MFEDYVFPPYKLSWHTYIGKIPMKLPTYKNHDDDVHCNQVFALPENENANVNNDSS